ncbi:MAG: PIN domain-containing protein [Paracoccus sp. (in: a-proteobacteria)]|uniref:RSP_2648 family PIN domain-containing protein n=1 Tax=Paracoccus sp. TaxID=267 RepID=UPI0026E10125|nr:PIN domain-containing protein [Paracoccus sp. (in: a-proteobacteria)]MDO5613223.1 PIN domain-containing protein [Paracoccus sp. (in: a-proteobacteria)]
MRAVLDACVLYPTVLREILTDPALVAHYAPVWTPRLRDEWLRAADRHGIRAAAGAEAALLADRIPPAADARAIPAVDLPDAADLHVLAAAIDADAALIVTLNLRDFPQRVLAPLGVRALHPDAFLLDLHRDHPAAVVQAVRAVHDRAVRLGGDLPLRALLKRSGLPRLAKALA